ncbi:MAG: hypothetical protein ACKVOR_03975 [Flavobacteriales bacterium]
MKYLCALPLFLLISLHTLAQKKNEGVGMRVPVQIKWAKGETSYFTITEKKEKVAADEYSKISSTHTVRLKVLDKTDTSYTIEWTYTESAAVIEEFELRGAVLRMGQQEELKDLMSRMLLKTAESIKGMRVVYTTDQYGTFIDVQNRDELREQYKKTFTTMMVDVVATLPQAQQDSMQVFVAFMSAAIVGDPDFGVNFSDIQLLHQPFGYEYEVGATQEMQGYWPSPFNDNEYPVDIKLTLDKYNSGEKKANLHGVNTIGDEAMHLFIADLHEMLAAYGLEDEAKDVSYDITSDYNLNIDLSYGWIYDAHMTTRQKENHDISTTTLDIKLRL